MKRIWGYAWPILLGGAVVSLFAWLMEVAVQNGEELRERREAEVRQLLVSEYEVVEAWRTSDLVLPESTYVLRGGTGEARLTVVTTHVWLVGDRLQPVKQSPGQPADSAYLVKPDGKQTELYGYRFERLFVPLGAEKAP